MIASLIRYPKRLEEVVIPFAMGSLKLEAKVGRLHVIACECVRVHVIACECMRVHASACQCVRVHASALVGL